MEQAINSLFPMLVLYLANRALAHSVYEFVAAAQAILSMVPAVGGLIAANYMSVNFSGCSQSLNSYRLYLCAGFIVLVSMLASLLVYVLNSESAKAHLDVFFFVLLTTVLSSLFALGRVYLILAGGKQVRAIAVSLAIVGVLIEVFLKADFLGLYWSASIGFGVAVAVMFRQAASNGRNIALKRRIVMGRQLYRYFLSGAAGYGAFWFGTVGLVALITPLFGFSGLGVIRSSHSASNAITAFFSSFDPVVIRRARELSHDGSFVKTWLSRYFLIGLGLYAILLVVVNYGEAWFSGFFDGKVLAVYAIGAVVLSVSKVYSIRVLTRFGPWKSARASIVFAPCVIPIWLLAVYSMDPVNVAAGYVLATLVYFFIIFAASRE